MNRPKYAHCARKNHRSEDCRFKNATCFRCRQKGHIATVCQVSKSSGLEKVLPIVLIGVKPVMIGRRRRTNTTCVHGCL